MRGFAVLMRGWDALISRVRNRWYAALGVQLGGYVWMRHVSIPRQWSDIYLGKSVALDDGVVLLASGPDQKQRITIEADTYINRHSMIDAHSSVHIGRKCLIGPFCYITDSDHVASSDERSGRMTSAPVRIEDNVWLGAGVIVLKGVTIGRGAVVGAGAVVTKNVAPREVVAGVPARALSRVTDRPVTQRSLG